MQTKLCMQTKLIVLRLIKKSYTKNLCQIVNFETDLASNTLTSAESRDEGAIYNKFSLGEMNTDVSKDFDWLKYVQKVMAVTDDFNELVIHFMQ